MESGLTVNYYIIHFGSKMTSRHGFCPLMWLYTHRRNHYHRPAVHSNDVIHMHRSDQHSPGWTVFSHYLCITISLPLLWHHSLHVSFTLFYNNSLYHLLMLFSPLFQPSALLADLILPFLFMFLFPTGFWGLRNISVFQADVLALFS